MARKRKSSSAKPKSNLAGAQRLQRLLAAAGFGSRRQCEKLIEEARIEVDGETVTKLGTTVDLDLQKVRVDGVLLKKQKLVYYAVNKPNGIVTTNRDPKGRPRVVDLVPRDERVFPVGRLDMSSEGLILLTNDGELAQRLTHPKYGVRKVYRVTVAGKVDGPTMRRMREGIHIAEGLVKVEGAKLIKARARSTEMEIILKEGKNREIRRILARFGHKVQQLRRIAVGPLRLGDLPVGAHRSLRSNEVEKLWAAVERGEIEQEAESQQKAKGPRGPRKKASTKNAIGRRPSGPAKFGKKTTSKKATKKAATKRTATKPTAKKRTSSAPDFLSLTSTSSQGAVIGGDEPQKPKAEKKSRPRKAAKSRSATSSRKRSVKQNNRKKRR